MRESKERLHLDPAFGPAPQVPTVSPMGIPPLTLAPPVVEQSPTAAPNLGLDPLTATKLFGNYTDDPGLRPASPHVPPPSGAVAPAGQSASFGFNAAGPGVTVGDWQFGGAPVRSRSLIFDGREGEKRAHDQEENARAARRHGDAMPNPIGDLLAHTWRNDVALASPAALGLHTAPHEPAHTPQQAQARPKKGPLDRLAEDVNAGINGVRRVDFGTEASKAFSRDVIPGIGSAASAAANAVGDAFDGW